jgi:hypothetical protein
MVGFVHENPSRWVLLGIHQGIDRLLVEQTIFVEEWVLGKGLIRPMLLLLLPAHMKLEDLGFCFPERREH